MRSESRFLKIIVCRPRQHDDELESGGLLGERVAHDEERTAGKDRSCQRSAEPPHVSEERNKRGEVSVGGCKWNVEDSFLCNWSFEGEVCAAFALGTRTCSGG